MDRRGFHLLAIGAVAVSVSSATSACSPPVSNGADALATLLQAIGERENAKAAAAIAPDAQFFLVDPEIAQVGRGPAKITAELRKLIEQGYRLALAGDDEPSIAPAEDYGPWQRFTLWRELEGGGYVHETTCGWMSDAFDLLVSGNPITSLALVRAPLSESMMKVAREIQRASSRG